VHGGRPALAAAGACLAGTVVLAHALLLASWVGRALPSRLGGTVWFYVAAAAALLAGMGIGLWLADGASDPHGGRGGAGGPLVAAAAGRRPGHPAAVSAAGRRGRHRPSRQAVKTRPARATSLSSIRPIA
jgi:hypothetical protein